MRLFADWTQSSRPLKEHVGRIRPGVVTAARTCVMFFYGNNIRSFTDNSDYQAWKQCLLLDSGRSHGASATLVTVSRKQKPIKTIRDTMITSVSPGFTTQTLVCATLTLAEWAVFSVDTTHREREWEKIIISVCFSLNVLISDDGSTFVSCGRHRRNVNQQE